MQVSMMMPMGNMDEVTDHQRMPCGECYSDSESYALKDAGNLKTDPIIISATVPADSIKFALNNILDNPIAFIDPGARANAPPLVGTIILRT